ncbi:MAG: DnaJ domain-containing protein [Deltaproteobacteria bacterium]|nr:DnaJ domain-containing protein [Candidatus Zymogenaceae bacterium]
MSEHTVLFVGNLSETPFPKLLSEINSMGITGRLSFERGKINKQVFFKNGRPFLVTSNILQEVLGRFLVSTGKITEEQYKRSLVTAKEFGKLHGQVMIQEKFLTSEELNEALREQSRFRLFSLFKWNDCDYKFFREDFFQERDEYADLTITDIILNGIRQSHSLDRLISLLEPYRNLYLFPGAENSRLDADSTFDEHQRWLLNLCDGTHTVGDTLDLSPLDFIETHRTIYAAIILNIITIKKDSASEIQKREAPTPPRPEGVPLEKEAPPPKKPDEEFKELHTKLMAIYHQMRTKSYFDILRVQQDSPDAEIKKSYIKMAKKFHPDSFSPEEIVVVEKTVNKIFDIVTQAYRVLSDEKKRKEYIASLVSPKEGKDAKQTHDIMTAELQFQKGMVFLKKRDYRNAFESFAWAVKLMPDEGEYLAYLGWSIFLFSSDKTGPNSVQAIKHLKKAATLNPSIETPFLFLGTIYKVQGLKDVSILNFKKALDINPDSLEARRELTALGVKQKGDEQRRGLFGKKK